MSVITFECIKVLNRAKKLLIERTTEMFINRRDELEFDEYADHFQEMGIMISMIDETESLGQLITKLEKGEFEVIGLFTSDDDMLEEFLRDLVKSL